MASHATYPRHVRPARSGAGWNRQRLCLIPIRRRRLGAYQGLAHRFQRSHKTPWIQHTPERPTSHTSRRRDRPHHGSAVRIFTPVDELPFAGHPLVGAAWLLNAFGPKSAKALRTRVGAVSCSPDMNGARVTASFDITEAPDDVADVAIRANMHRTAHCDSPSRRATSWPATPHRTMLPPPNRKYAQRLGPNTLDLRKSMPHLCPERSSHGTPRIHAARRTLSMGNGSRVSGPRRPCRIRIRIRIHTRSRSDCRSAALWTC